MLRRDFLQAALVAPVAGLTGTVKANTGAEEKPFIVNAGVGGNNTVDLLARIEKDCLVHRPDMTILMVGTNDMNSKKYIPLPTYRQNLLKLIGLIRDAGSEVLLMTILPAYEPYLYTRHPESFYAPEGYQGRKNQVNELIRKTAEELKLHFLDLHHIFEKVGNIGESPDSLLQNMANTQKTDGVHPTPDGYRTIAVAVYEKLLTIAAPHKRLVCFGDSITNGGGGTDGRSYPAYLKRLLGY